MFLVRSFWNPIACLLACCVLTTASVAQPVEPTPPTKQPETPASMIPPEIGSKQSDPTVEPTVPDRPNFPGMMGGPMGGMGGPMGGMGGPMGGPPGIIASLEISGFFTQTARPRQPSMSQPESTFLDSIFGRPELPAVPAGGSLNMPFGGPMPLTVPTTTGPLVPTHFSSIRQEVSLMAPLWLEEGNMLSATFNARTTYYDTDVILPMSQVPFPETLSDIRLGVNYNHMFSNGWSLGGMVSIGSSSDKPFRTWDEVNVGVNAMLRIPSRERNAWLISLNYMPNGEFDFPIPGIAYFWYVNDQFQMNVGLPFSINWRPSEEWFINLTYMPIRTVMGRITYRPDPKWSAYVSFNWTTESYFLADRVDQNQRFSYSDKRITTGVIYQINSNWQIEGTAGYAFDRSYFQGMNTFTDNDFDRIDIGDGPYLALKLQKRF